MDLQYGIEVLIKKIREIDYSLFLSASGIRNFSSHTKEYNEAMAKYDQKKKVLKKCIEIIELFQINLEKEKSEN